MSIFSQESTYGIHEHLGKEEREERFTGAITETVKNGGRVLIPVFALGRAQELLLILGKSFLEQKLISDQHKSLT